MGNAVENEISEINRRQDEVIEEFALFDDWMDKYDHLISLGKELPLIDESLKTDDRIIRGCQSKVWLDAGMEDGKVQFTADSDAIITKGIIATLVRVLNGNTPAGILETDLYFIDRIGLKEHLSPTRSNGLLAMVKQMKIYALAFQAKND
ncbi:MAG: SufE family protein [Cryomorphaceae bacterium]|nr:MAG: SufE family protein [Cryomorphaceae bacterium]